MFEFDRLNLHEVCLSVCQEMAIVKAKCHQELVKFIFNVLMIVDQSTDSMAVCMADLFHTSDLFYCVNFFFYIFQ